MMPSLLLLLLGRFSRVRLCATPYRAAHQAPPSLGFSRQEHWSGLPFPCPVHASEKWKWSRSVVSDSLRPHGLQPTRLLCPWDFPGKSTGVGCHCLLRMPSIHSHRRKTYCSPPVCFSFTFTLLSHLTELHSWHFWSPNMWSFSPTAVSSWQHQLGVLQFNSLVTLFTWKW